MGQFQFRLPDIGEGVVEAEITAWHVKPGDRVREDQPLLDVMTDKATVDMSSPVEGLVTAIHGAVGSKAPVGSVLVDLDVAEIGEASAARTGQPPAEPVAHTSEPAASPAIRRQAQEWGIELGLVTGTGPGGRILSEDLERHRQARDQAHRAPPQHKVEEIPIQGLRKRIAERMAESKRTIPHFSYVEEFDLTELEGLRANLNAGRGEERPKLTLLPFFMRAVARLVPEFPNINAHLDMQAGILKRFSAVHIGIATQTPNGLMVPVVRHAETRDLWDLAGELARVTAQARDGSASRDQLTGSTITLTSLGALGGIAATPIINPPEVAILGPNKLAERPMVVGGVLTCRKVMNLSASFNHGVIDGHEAASFIQRLKRLMEHPALIFMD